MDDARPECCSPRAPASPAPAPGPAPAGGRGRGPARARRGHRARRARGRRRHGKHAAGAPGEAPPTPWRGPNGRPPVPDQIRGVHVTMALASLPGKLQQYFAHPGPEHDRARRQGRERTRRLRAPARAAGPPDRRVGPVLRREEGRRQAHEHGIYLIGRVVTFEDPVLSAKRPDLAVHRSDGSLWLNNCGSRLDEPVRPARLALRRRRRRGRREGRLRRDPVRLRALPERRRPLDRSATRARTRSRCAGRSPPSRSTPRTGCTRSACASRWTSSASRRRATSASARSRAGSRATSTPSTRWSTRRTTTRASTELPEPDDAPGQMVSRSLSDFQRALEGRKTRLVPWLQDFSLGRTYTLDDVEPQIAAARAHHRAASCSGTRKGSTHADALAPR